MRWAARHGLARMLLARAARRGDLDARQATDPRLREDPYPGYAAVRDSGPLAPGPFGYVSADYATCATVLRSPAFGVATDTGRRRGIGRLLARLEGPPGVSPVDPPSLLAVDPPDHTRYRRQVTRVFSSRAIEGLRGRVEQVAGELLDDLAGAGTDPVDLVARYCSLLPVTVIAEVLGVPVGMRQQFLAWGDGAALTLDLGIGYRDFRRAERDLAALHAWMLGHFDRLRRSPSDSLLGQLVAQSQAGGGLTEHELAATAILLLGAGFETTVNLLGNGVVQLLRHPGELDRLQADPACWPNAVEEVLRYDSPVQRTARVAHRDTDVAGRPVRAGTLVLTLLGGANRDPAVFADPDRFDVRRDNARDSLSFSAGIHFCLGAALARLEGEVGLRLLFERLPSLALAGPPSRRPNRVLRGYDALPVTLG